MKNEKMLLQFFLQTTIAPNRPGQARIVRLTLSHDRTGSLVINRKPPIPFLSRVFTDVDIYFLTFHHRSPIIASDPPYVLKCSFSFTIKKFLIDFCKAMALLCVSVVIIHIFRAVPSTVAIGEYNINM